MIMLLPDPHTSQSRFRHKQVLQTGVDATARPPRLAARICNEAFSARLESSAERDRRSLH